MFKLAHLSDPHLGPLPDPKLVQLFSKRILGYLNWQRNRSKVMGGTVLDDLLADLKSRQPDHVAITGDLVNIALPAEISQARTWLDGIGAPDGISVVPGNHDAYVPGAAKKATTSWWPFMSGDGAPAERPSVRTTAGTFPYVRRRGKLALIGVSTARATGPWFATGRVGSAQARRLKRILDELGKEDLFRVVLLHHPPFKHATHWHKRLSDSSRIRAVVQRAGAELVLHGHTHIRSFREIEGPAGPVPVVGVPSATCAPGGHHHAAAYNLFTVSDTADGWTCIMEEFGFTPDSTRIEKLSERTISPAKTAA